MGLSPGDLTAIGIGLGSFAAWGKMFYDGRKNGKNGPGKVCALHESLALEIKTLHQENRDDHKKIFDDIKNLSIAVAGAAAAAATAATAAMTKRGK